MVHQLEGCKTYFAAIASVFQISLGAWDWDVIYEGGPIAILFFITYTIIGTIMLLNLLIAVRIRFLASSFLRLRTQSHYSLTICERWWHMLDARQHVQQHLGGPIALL